jgi:Family of unknown function (DUF6441)
MKLVATLARSLQAAMQVELRNIERAVTSGTRDAGRGFKTELRRQVASAGLGQRLANSWRDKHYPNRKLEAASLVYTKAPQIIRACDEGAMIRSRRWLFLALPTENAPKRSRTAGGSHRAPSRSTGSGRSGSCRNPMDRRSLWWTACAPRSAARPGSCEASDAQPIAAEVRSDGLTTLVMFLLLPQVKLRKRLHMARVAERWSAQLPALIEQQLRAE